MCAKIVEIRTLQDIIKSKRGKVEAVCKPATRISKRRYGRCERARRTKALCDKLRKTPEWGGKKQQQKAPSRRKRISVILRIALLISMGLAWWAPLLAMWQRIDYSDKAENSLKQYTKTIWHEMGEGSMERGREGGRDTEACRATPKFQKIRWSRKMMSIGEALE